jgi:enediyne biosynthesis protein E4
MKTITHLLVLTLSMLVLTNCNQKEDKFKKLKPSQTGISFVNEVKETNDINILDYLYFYNGGGVAAADFNADGLTDLYFVSTQGENKLYLNKTKEKNIKFEDITAKAGVAGKANWQTGVSVADINGDGRLDMYVCAVGNYKSLKGHNELYINTGNDANGVPMFEEKAKEYGLDFSGFSTQAAFIDYDKDGDLDVYLLNHAIHSVSSYDKVSARALVDSSAGDILYRNELIANSPTPHPTSHIKHPKLPIFTNVSQKAGIYQAAMGYGLGISVADFNNDGWDDIYVSNDFHEDDYYYLNNGNGTFKESVKEHFKHLSKYSMGCDVADINNDGWLDIFTADMLPDDEKIEKSSLGEDALDIYLYKLQFGFHYQYGRNALHLNMHGKRYADIATIAGVSATDWSWSPLLADFDNDGYRDLFVANGIPRRPNDLDYIKYLSNTVDSTIKKSIPTFAQKISDKKALDLMPKGETHNYIFRNSGDLKFENQSANWGFDEETVSNGAIYADLDNDGDLEIVTNDMNSEAGIFLNQSTEKDPENTNFLRIKLTGNNANTNGLGTQIYLKNKGKIWTSTQQPVRGFESSSEPIVHFGLGNISTIDSLIVVWPDGKSSLQTHVKTNQTLIFKQSEATINNGELRMSQLSSLRFTDLTDDIELNYQHRENKDYLDMVREPMMPFNLSTEGPKTAIGDVNGDGLDDLYLCGARNQAGQLMLQKNGQFVQSKQAVFKLDSAYEEVDALFFDADNDRDLDLYVVSGGNEFVGDMDELKDRLYVNDGKGNFSKTINALPNQMKANKSCVKPCDFDADGDIDLFVGGRVVAYDYGSIPESYLLVNDGKGHFINKTPNDLKNAGLITDAIWADIDNDKDQDLVVVGDWMPVTIFENKNKQLVKTTNTLSAQKGFWQTIQAADFDHDGDQDFVVGNLGLNNKFIKQAKPELKMYVKDIDANNKTEQIIAYKRNDKWYPLLSKDELGKQLPGIVNKRFTDYKDFAGKVLEDVIKPSELKGADELMVNRFESIYIENKGKGEFEVHHLPLEVQFSKIYAFLPQDFDGDGHIDLLAGGNFYGVSTYQGRYDASYGWYLKGDGKGHFKAVWPTASGFFIDGELRDLKNIKIANKNYILALTNNGKPRIFKSN